MHDLIVIGGGAAGLAAAAYALEKQLDLLVIAEQIGGKAGGRYQSAHGTPPTASMGEAVVELLAAQLAGHDEMVLHDATVKVTKTDGVFHVETAQHGVQQATTVVVATGVTPLPLDVPGGTKLVGYGLGYSVATYAQRLHGKVVAAIGPTHRALRGVHELSRIAAKVYWIGPDMTTLMSPLGTAIQYRDNVEALEGYQVTEIVGAEHVEAVVVARAGASRRLEVDAAFVDMGLKPNSSALQELVGLDMDGFIRIVETGATTLPGLYAAGDVTTAFGEQLLVAIGQGARAAVSAYEYLLSRPSARAVLS